MSNTFFTADTHWGHKKIIEYCPNRPFETIEEMNEGLIERWNSRVKPQDDVYHLGDFSFLPIEKTEKIIDQLNGNIHLILGNHDRAFEGRLKHKMSEVTHYKELPTKKFGVSIVLSHFPFESWNRMHHQALHFHGHLHSTSNHHPCTNMPNRMDVSVDAHPDCAPWSWDEIRENLKY